jgi:hypothetical protein
MNKKRLDPNALPYDKAEFAAKHNLSLSAATAVLTANSRSREQADIGAEIFKRASAEKRDKKPLSLPSL